MNLPSFSLQELAADAASVAYGDGALRAHLGRQRPSVANVCATLSPIIIANIYVCQKLRFLVIASLLQK